MRPLDINLLDTGDISEPKSAKKEDSCTSANLQNSPRVSEENTHELAGKFCDFALKSHQEN